jgi:hypothetical protein
MGLTGNPVQGVPQEVHTGPLKGALRGPWGGPIGAIRLGGRKSEAEGWGHICTTRIPPKEHFQIRWNVYIHILIYIHMNLSRVAILRTCYGIVQNWLPHFVFTISKSGQMHDITQNLNNYLRGSISNGLCLIGEHHTNLKNIGMIEIKVFFSILN